MVDEPDLLMEYNKDLSLKEAEKVIEANKESRKEAMDSMFGNGMGENGENGEKNAQIDEKDE